MQYHRRLRALSESPRTFHYFLNKCARSITHHTTDVAAMIITQSIKANGVTEIIHLGVRADNVRAIRLYQDLGFEEVGRFPGFFKIDGQYYDEILMNLYLR